MSCFPLKLEDPDYWLFNVKRGECVGDTTFSLT